jgi:carbon monoxide dehydrogenase subunit G
VPRYTTTIESPKPAGEVFAYLSDFATAAEWDPGVARAERLTPGPVRIGSKVEIVARFLGREVPLVYVVEALEERRRVLLRGENATTVSLDEIVVEPDGTGSRVTYDARLSLKGPLRLAEPALALIFRRIGDAAAQGLRDALGAR